MNRGGFGIRGQASGSFLQASFSYSSSIDALAGLTARYCVDRAYKSCPIVTLLHGYAQDSSTAYIDDGTAQRFAEAGFFVVIPNGRGHGVGAMDTSGRELYDIRDAVTYARGAFAQYVHPQKVADFGWSGGGGWAMGLQVKFPDFATTRCSMFGISDYGYDITNGWWTTDPGFQALLTAQVGNRAAGIVSPFRARNAQEALAGSLRDGGYLYLFHDTEDIKVDVRNSRLVRDALRGAGLGNFEYHESTLGDPVRWIHNYPNNVADNIKAEIMFRARALYSEPWSLPIAGSQRVIGYQESKRFACWLSTGATPKATGGLDAVADVAYDTRTHQYTVTPLTGQMYVEIFEGSRYVKQQIAATTILTAA